MSSLVLELQQLALQQPCDFGSLLRHALFVATKLGIDEFRKWANQELNGYENIAEADLPEYRQITTDIRCFNPYRGVLQQVYFSDSSFEKAASQAGIFVSIGQVEHLLEQAKELGPLQIPFAPEISVTLMQTGRFPSPPTRIVPTTELYGILDTVRTMILQWSMELERQGILGEGMTFTKQEKEKAMSEPTINIQKIDNFQGILGSVTDSPVAFGNENVLHSRLSQCRIDIEERQEFERIADKLKKTTEAEERRSLIERGTEWIKKHSAALGVLGGELLRWLTQSK